MILRWLQRFRYQPYATVTAYYTHANDLDRHDEVTFSLYQNGRGKRRCEVNAVSCMARSFATQHPLYVVHIEPWINGFTDRLPSKAVYAGRRRTATILRLVSDNKDGAA